MSRIFFTILMIWIFSTNAIASVVAACPHMTAPVVMDQSDDNAHSAHQQSVAEMNQMDHNNNSDCADGSCDTAASGDSFHDCGSCPSHCSSSVLIAFPSFEPEYVANHYESYFLPSLAIADNQRLLRPPRLS